MNVTFIGMTGAGKSYVGARYAKEHGMAFIDIDREMEQEFKKPLQTILDELGEETFLAHQAQQVLRLQNVANTVIAPGGSVVYSEEAMECLQAISKIIYLEVPLAVIEKRIDVTSRGIVGLKDKSLRELYDERVKLYEQWADEIVDASEN